MSKHGKSWGFILEIVVDKQLDNYGGRYQQFTLQCAVSYTDIGSAYQQVFPSKRHQAVGKQTGKTNYIERFNCTLRQRISPLVRKTLSFSKKFENHVGAIWYARSLLQCILTSLGLSIFDNFLGVTLRAKHIYIWMHNPSLYHYYALLPTKESLQNNNSFQKLMPGKHNEIFKKPKLIGAYQNIALMKNSENTIHSIMSRMRHYSVKIFGTLK
jgi:IS1 family transposase